MPSLFLEHITEHPELTNAIITKFGEKIRNDVDRGIPIDAIDVSDFPEFFLGPNVFDTLNLQSLSLESRVALTQGACLPESAFTKAAFEKIRNYREVLHDTQEKLKAQFSESASNELVTGVSIHIANELAAIKHLITTIEQTNPRETVDHTRTQLDNQNAILLIMQNEMMYGLEDDPEAQAIRSRFTESYQLNNCVSMPSSGTAINLTLRFQKDIAVRRKQIQQMKLREQQLHTTQQIGLNIIEGASQLANLTQSHELMRFTKIITLGVKLSEGFYQFEKASQLLNAGLYLSGAAAITGGVAAFIGIASALLKDNDDDSTVVIQKAVLEMWGETRQSFQHTWGILEKMEENCAKRFLISCRYFENISGETTRIRHEQDAHFQQAKAQLSHFYHIMHSGILERMDADQRQAINEIVEADEPYLKAHFPTILARLTDWLQVIASNPSKTGFIEPSSLTPSLILASLNTHNDPSAQLGFYSALCQTIVPSVGQSLLSDLTYPHVVKAYSFMRHYRGVSSESDKQRVLQEINSLLHQTQASCAFFEGLSGHSGNQLMLGCIDRYNYALAAIASRFNAWLNHERQQLHQRHLSPQAIQQMPHLRDIQLLDPAESLQQTYDRLLLSNWRLSLLDDWEMILPRHDRNSHWYDEAWMHRWGLQRLGYYSFKLRYGYFYIGNETPRLIVGSERAKTIRTVLHYNLDIPPHVEKLIGLYLPFRGKKSYWTPLNIDEDLRADIKKRYDALRPVADLLNAFEQHPLLSMGYAYGFFQLTGTWAYLNAQYLSPHYLLMRLHHLLCMFDMVMDGEKIQIACLPFTNPTVMSGDSPIFRDIDDSERQVYGLAETAHTIHHDTTLRITDLESLTEYAALGEYYDPITPSKFYCEGYEQNRARMLSGEFPAPEHFTVAYTNKNRLVDLLRPKLEALLCESRKNAARTLLTHEAAFLFEQCLQLEVARRTIIAFQRLMGVENSTPLVSEEEIRTKMQDIVNTGSFESVDNMKQSLTPQPAPQLQHAIVHGLPLYAAMQQASDQLTALRSDIETAPFTTALGRMGLFARSGATGVSMGLGTTAQPH